MKKLILFLLLVISITAQAQISYGSFTYFPDNKMMGLYFKPQINFSKFDDLTVIGLRCCSPVDYKSFDDESRLFIRFSDETMIKLNIIKDLDIVKDFKTDYNKITGTTKFYTTFSFYEIDEDTVDKIVNGNVNIIKIRIVYTNGEIEDFDIKEKYQPKLMEGLRKSLANSEKQNEKRKANMNDDDF